MLNNEFLALNPSETAIYSLISSVISILSFMGSSFIISVYYCFPELQTFGFKLVIFLSCADLAFSLSKMLSLFGSFDMLCEIQAYFINSSQLSSVLWTVIISHTLKNTLIYQDHEIDHKEKTFLFIGFIFPLAYSLIPLVIGMFGYTGCYCWISIDPSDKFWGNFFRIIQFELFLWFALGYNFYWYIRCIRFLRRVYKQEVNKSLLFRLFSYPMVLVFCWSWATINRIYNVFWDDSTTLNILQIVFVSFEGLFNAVIYGLNKNVRNCLKEKFFKKKVEEALVNTEVDDIEMSEYINNNEYLDK